MSRRFIVRNENIEESNGNIVISGDEVKHIQVLRFNVGDVVHVNDSMYKIVSMTRDTIELEYIEKAQVLGVPKTNITLYMAFLKSDKMDFVVQKAVELGVSKIVPFLRNSSTSMHSNFVSISFLGILKPSFDRFIRLLSPL